MAAPKKKNPPKKLPTRLPEKLTKLAAELNGRAGALTSPVDADKALIMRSLALLSEGVGKLARDARAAKNAESKAAGSAATPKS